ncbi:MAG: hypothetical protein HQL72_10305 [Magnetococcales bacterium]|nr:hypothetical protein [Magnetococcales bacterium]
MRFSIILALLLALVPWQDVLAASDVYYQKGRYTVRKVEGTCKLEIALHHGKKQSGAILALFPTDDYYGEFFTQKEAIGLAHRRVQIQFDKNKPTTVPFVLDAAQKDGYWSWQYLESTDGLLKNVAKKRDMTVRFSNVKGNKYKYDVSLSGSGNAVKALKKCR